MKHKQPGFTLLELAIVLIVIALVAGFILGARSVVRTSQLQTMLGEYDANLKAIKEFQDKFLALPGDMNNAESMWGTDTSCLSTFSSSTPHVATCNGNGILHGHTVDIGRLSGGGDFTQNEERPIGLNLN